MTTRILATLATLVLAAGLAACGGSAPASPNRAPLTKACQQFKRETASLVDKNSVAAVKAMAKAAGC